MDFITDRTQGDVEFLEYVRRKGYENLTAYERQQWERGRGAYNYNDLNRVESNVEWLAGQLGLTLTVKTNWTIWDVPTTSDMNRYLYNIRMVRDACTPGLGYPTLPTAMSNLTYAGANAIEKVLEICYQDVRGSSAVLGMGRLGSMVLGESLIAG